MAKAKKRAERAGCGSPPDRRRTTGAPAGAGVPRDQTAAEPSVQPKVETKGPAEGREERRAARGPDIPELQLRSDGAVLQSIKDMGSKVRKAVWLYADNVQGVEDSRDIDLSLKTGAGRPWYAVIYPNFGDDDRNPVVALYAPDFLRRAEGAEGTVTTYRLYVKGGRLMAKPTGTYSVVGAAETETSAGGGMGAALAAGAADPVKFGWAGPGRPICGLCEEAVDKATGRCSGCGVQSTWTPEPPRRAPKPDHRPKNRHPSLEERVRRLEAAMGRLSALIAARAEDQGIKPIAPEGAQAPEPPVDIEAAVQAQVARWSNLKVSQLKRAAKEAGLPVSGKKDDIISRLAEKYRANLESAAEA